MNLFKAILLQEVGVFVFIILTDFMLEKLKYLMIFNKFEESCWCSINLENNKSLLIGAIYRSPSSTEAKCGSRGGGGGQGLRNTPPPWKITSYMGFYRE